MDSLGYSGEIFLVGFGRIRTLPNRWFDQQYVKLLAHGMSTQNAIADEVRDLLAYFPGRGRLPLLWLFALPLIELLCFSHFSPAAKLSGGKISYAVFSLPGLSILWLYISTVLVLLVRINHSDRSSWLESASIIASSITYGIIISLPSFLISIAWAATHVGISILSFLYILLGTVEVLGAILLLATALGGVAHYAGFFIAFFLFLMKTAYVYLLPFTYSITAVPEKWRMLQAATPLAPAIVILRAGILNYQLPELASPLYWVAASVHAIIGYAVAFRIWRTLSNRFASPHQDTLGLHGTAPLDKAPGFVTNVLRKMVE